jgi:hypothetical protein
MLILLGGLGGYFEFVDIIVVARVIGCDVLGGEEIACMFLFYVNHSLITIAVVHLFLGELVHHNFISLNFVLSF